MMKSMNIAILVSVASLLLSSLSALNQIAGFFSRISLPTAIMSALLAVMVALAFPTLLRKERPEGQTAMGMPYGLFSVALAVLILAVGVGPFLAKFWVAAQAETEGSELVDLHRYGPARVQMDRAVRYFGDLGFGKRAVQCKLHLIEVCAGLGDGARADDLIAEVENSGFLDEHLQGKLYVIRGSIAHERGRFTEAERFYQLAHQTIETGSQGEAVLLQNEGVLWAGRGTPYRDRVLHNYEQAREIYQQLDDEVGLVHILINEGNLHDNDPQAARTLYEQALGEAEKVGDPYLLGVITMNIGVTYRQQGDLDQAEELYGQSRLNFEEAADLLGQAEVAVNLATVEWVRGRRELARQHLQTSESYLRNVDLSRERDHPGKVALIRSFQADIYDKVGESQAAESLYEEALAIYSQHPDPLREAITRVNYGALLLRLNRSQEARSQIGRAREILEAYGGEGPHQTLGVLYNNLGKVYQDTGDFTNALNYYGRAVRVFEALEEPMLHAQATENLGIVRGFQGDMEEGEKCLLEALEIYRELENRDHEAQTLFNLYSLYTSMGEPSAASMVEEILALLEEYSIDQESEAGILFGILPQDIADHAELIVYRERLQQLRVFYGERNEPIGLGRSLLKLASVEQILQNWSKMLQYARDAEAYAGSIPLPLRISFHTDLGFFFLTSDTPEDGIDHFLEAFDLAETVSIEHQRALALVIQTYVSIHADDIDREKCRKKAQLVVETADDAVIVSMFQEIVDLLSPASD
jgi:tetratricopeptide (TPR) repeat protein